MAETRALSLCQLSLIHSVVCLWLPRIPLGTDVRLSAYPTNTLDNKMNMLNGERSTMSLNTASITSTSLRPLERQNSSGSGYGSVDDDQAEGGFDVKLVSEVNTTYECPICSFVMRSPIQTKCGHRFCHNCIRKWINCREQIRPDYKAFCPNCSESLTIYDIFTDNFAKREVMSLQMYCPNFIAGCVVIMEIRHVKKHLALCDYVELQCPNGCLKLFMRKHMQEHVNNTCERRMVDCPVCHTLINIKRQEAHLELECPMVELACKHCSMTLIRIQLTKHMQEDCPKMLVDCDFLQFGCTTKIEREQLETHLQLSIQYHIRMIADAVESIRESLQRVENPTKATGYFEQHIEHIKHKPPISLKDANKYISELVQQKPQTSMHIAQNPYLSIPQSLSLSTPEGPSLGSLTLNLPTSSSETIHSTLEQELDNLQVSSIRRYSGISRPHSLGKVEERLNKSSYFGISSATVDDLDKIRVTQREQTSKLAKQDEQITDLHMQNQTLIEKVDLQQAMIRHLEEQRQEFSLQNCSGTFIWKVQNYCSKKMEAKCGSRTVIHSPGFYSSLYGYKLCVRLNLNGVESAIGTHISLFVHFMQGEYDDILDWPFSGRISLSILDQTNTSQLRQNITETLLSKPTLAAFQRPSTSRNHKGFGYVEFSPLNMIEGTSPSYLRNDTIYIKVKVDTG